MEPRPQRPRPQTPPSGAPPNGGQPAPQIGPDPSQQAQYQSGQPGVDPAAFVAPPRMEYDYSPLDLQPPGQRRKRQIIAGIIGALVVVAIGALIVAGWMALRDDDEPVDNNNTNDRVAELNSTATEEAANEENDTEGEGTPAADNDAATEAPTEPPPTPTEPETTVYDEDAVRAELPVVESMPGTFEDAGETILDLEGVTNALGGGPEAEALLSENGWQASISKTYNSTDPATTGTTQIVVSVHAFQDGPSALATLPEFEGILQGFGWTSTEMEEVGDGSRMLLFTDPETGEEAVTIYVVDGQILYRVFAIGPTGVDSTENAIHVVNQLLGQ